MKALPWLINWTIAVGLMLAVMHLHNTERQYDPCHFSAINGCAHVTIWEEL
jgi:hypothetical protein